MSRHLDHVVVWVEDPLRSLAWFEDVVGFPGVRVEEFRAGKVLFPSVRISDDTLLDLMSRSVAPKLNARLGAMAEVIGASAGHPVNHLCISMSQEEFESLQERLERNGTPAIAFMENSFGAKGQAPRTFYFYDPDGNVYEARYYAGDAP